MSGEPESVSLVVDSLSGEPAGTAQTSEEWRDRNQYVGHLHETSQLCSCGRTVFAPSGSAAVCDGCFDTYERGGWLEPCFVKVVHGHIVPLDDDASDEQRRYAAALDAKVQR